MDLFYIDYFEVLWFEREFEHFYALTLKAVFYLCFDYTVFGNLCKFMLVGFHFSKFCYYMQQGLYSQESMGESIFFT